jgi:hypothetical protein
VDSAGNIYFADFCAERIRKVANGMITSVAGNGQENFFACAVGASGPDTGKATSVPLDTPRAVAVDAAGNVYFTEGLLGPYRVRKVSTGNISTVAGGNSGLQSGPARGDNIPATTAKLEFAAYNTIAIDVAGNIHIPDEYWVAPPPGGVYRGDIESTPEFGRLRKVSNGVITTLAGSSVDSGLATGAQLNLPAGLAVDGAGNLYIAEGNGIVREVSNGTINTIAGTRVGGGCGCDSGIPSGVNITPRGSPRIPTKTSSSPAASVLSWSGHGPFNDCRQHGREPHRQPDRRRSARFRHPSSRAASLHLQRQSLVRPNSAHRRHVHTNGSNRPVMRLVRYRIASLDHFCLPSCPHSPAPAASFSRLPPIRTPSTSPTCLSPGRRSR